MKRSILAIAAAIILTTPAYADKMPIRNPQITKPVHTCAENTRLAEWMVIHHLDQIEILIDEMRKNILQAEQKPKPKPVDNRKKSG